MTGGARREAGAPVAFGGTMAAKKRAKKKGAKAKADSERVWNGNPALEPWLMPIDDILLDPANERDHPVENVEGIRASFRRFGQQTPIVIDKDRVVRKGNGSLVAVRAEGWTHIAALPTNLEDEASLTGYRVADNRTSELATWNWDALKASYDLLVNADDLAAFDESFRVQLQVMAEAPAFEKLPPIQEPGEMYEHIDLRLRLSNLSAREEAQAALVELCEMNPQWQARVVTRENNRANQ